jgi:hypothetical protein
MLYTPVPPGHFACAWDIKTEVKWTRGPLIEHGGCNGRHLAECYVLPEENRAALNHDHYRWRWG